MCAVAAWGRASPPTIPQQLCIKLEKLPSAKEECLVNVMALPDASSQVCLWTGDTRAKRVVTQVQVCVWSGVGLILLLDSCRTPTSLLCTWTYCRLLQGPEYWPAPQPECAQLSSHT